MSSTYFSRYVNSVSTGFAGTLTLLGLVDAINTELQEHPCEGLELHGRNEQSVCACKIVKVLGNRNTTQYQVGWLDKDRKITGTSVVNAVDLIFKKTPFSRALLKAFIRESTSRSAPWVIHEKFAKKYGILTEIPQELREKLTMQNELLKAGKKRTRGNQSSETNLKRKRTEVDDGTEEVVKEESVKYPIDDLLVRPAADDPNFTHRPSLSTKFKVPIDCRGDLLMIWDFCSSFSRLLNLSPFSLEDFENAICHKDSNLLLIVESHSAILRLLIKDEGDYFQAIRTKKQKLKVKISNWAEFLCHFLEMRNRVDLLQYMATIKRGHYGLLETHIKLSILHELVVEALSTNVIRVRLDERVEQQQALGAKKREEIKKKREEQLHGKEETDTKEVSNGCILENGKDSMHASDVDNMSTLHEGIHEGSQEVKSSKRKTLQENGGRNNEIGNTKKLYSESPEAHGKRKNKDNNPQHNKPEDLGEQLDREIEKLSIRTSPLGTDRDYSRYWFFRREGRLFVESSDSKQWGYYTIKEELDALIGSLNPKGERERALKSQLEKHYLRISNALQKRSKEVANRALMEEAALRRSARVQAQPRDSDTSFLTYVNKWKENSYARFSNGRKRTNTRSALKEIEPR